MSVLLEKGGGVDCDRVCLIQMDLFHCEPEAEITGIKRGLRDPEENNCGKASELQTERGRGEGEERRTDKEIES